MLNPNAPVDKLIIKEQMLNAAAPLQTMIDKLAKVPLLAQPGTRWRTASPWTCRAISSRSCRDSRSPSS